MAMRSLFTGRICQSSADIAWFITIDGLSEESLRGRSQFSPYHSVGGSSILRKWLPVRQREWKAMPQEKESCQQAGQRERCVKEMQYTNTYQSPLGEITMASNGTSLTGLWFRGAKYFAATLAAEHEEKALPIFEQTGRWLDAYFQGQIPDFTPPMCLEGSEFRLAVWGVLRRIPYGQVMTYGEIAGILARQRGLTDMSAQAVGGAVGHNPISIIVPCHRVIGSNGSLTGYAGGIQKKSRLLALEKVDMEHLFIPKKGAAL